MSEDFWKRPYCCVEPRCTPIYQMAERVDLSIPKPGESFSCWGVMPEEINFDYDDTPHANDLRSCHYTPLKGVVAFQENRDDWNCMKTGYAHALEAVARADSGAAEGKEEA